MFVSACTVWLSVSLREGCIDGSLTILCSAVLVRCLERDTYRVGSEEQYLGGADDVYVEPGHELSEGRESRADYR